MTITTMHSEEYRYILAELGLMPYRRAAEVLHISQRSVAGYGSGDMASPEPTAMLLWLWLQIKSDRRKVKLPFDS